MRKNLTKFIFRIDKFWNALDLGIAEELRYLTIFTKTDKEWEEWNSWCEDQFSLIDNSNGPTYRIIPLTGSKVDLVRIRKPDNSKIKVAGDILKTNLDEMERLFKIKGIEYLEQLRPENKLLSITSAIGQEVIYFPEKHILDSQI